MRKFERNLGLNICFHRHSRAKAPVSHWRKLCIAHRRYQYWCRLHICVARENCARFPHRHFNISAMLLVRRSWTRSETVPQGRSKVSATIPRSFMTVRGGKATAARARATPPGDIKYSRAGKPVFPLYISRESPLGLFHPVCKAHTRFPLLASILHSLNNRKK